MLPKAQDAHRVADLRFGLSSCLLPSTMRAFCNSPRWRFPIVSAVVLGAGVRIVYQCSGESGAMDFATTLITLGALLSLVTLVGAAFSFLLAHDRNAPSYRLTRR